MHYHTYRLTAFVSVKGEPAAMLDSHLSLPTTEVYARTAKLLAVPGAC
jgi:hypothetical protein